jgi:ribosomal protein S18 acetylase RimI-like enzyme
MALIRRPIAGDDWSFCVRVHHVAMRTYVESLWGWDEAKQGELAIEFLKHRDATHEIAVVDDVPIGYLSFQDRTQGLFLNKLCLHPDWQDRGYGSEILSDIIRLVASEQKPIELSVISTNPRARAFYERHGFAVIERTRERIHMRRAGGAPSPR